MQINLSGDMIQSVCEVAFGDIKSLENSIQICEMWLANCITKSDAEIRRHQLRLTDLKSSLETAHEVHNTFIELRDRAVQNGELVG